MQEKKHKNVFIKGAISPVFIGDCIANHSAKHNIGAHSVFLGQVRADEKDKGKVVSIVYEAYSEMAEDKLYEIREAAFEKFELTCMHIYHSLGAVKVGEMSLFVFTSSEHRKPATEACSYIVDRIKKEVPVWGREILEGGEAEWKVNQ